MCASARGRARDRPGRCRVRSGRQPSAGAAATGHSPQCTSACGRQRAGARIRTRRLRAHRCRCVVERSAMAAARRVRHRPRCVGLRDLHVGFHRRAEGRDAEPCGGVQHACRHQRAPCGRRGRRGAGAGRTELRPVRLRFFRRDRARRVHRAARSGARQRSVALGRTDGAPSRDAVELGARPGTDADRLSRRRTGARRAGPAPRAVVGRLDSGDAAGPLVAPLARQRTVQPRRRDRSVDLVDRASDPSGRHAAREHSVRPRADRADDGSARRARPAVPAGRARRDPYRRRRARDGLRERSGADGRTVHPSSGRAQALPHRRSRARARRRLARIPRAAGRSGENPRVPDRAGRDRCGADRASARRRGRDDRARRRRGAPARELRVAAECGSACIGAGRRAA
ncbi:hypothetical protein P355_2980 [Burkholderia cenocepacia KC-01]|nr:hypothetical protein P355_2980 [Burkholderia cenocepacia KC-01]